MSDNLSVQSQLSPAPAPGTTPTTVPNSLTPPRADEALFWNFRVSRDDAKRLGQLDAKLQLKVSAPGA